LPSINIYQNIKKIAEQKGVAGEKIKEIIIEAFRDSYQQKENPEADLHLKFNEELVVYRRYQIVEQVNNPEREVTKNSELLKEGELKDGNFFLPIDTKNLSLEFSREFEKQLAQKLRWVSYEKENTKSNYLPGQLIWGTLQNKEENNYIFNLEPGWGYWSERERFFLTEKLAEGQKMAFLIKEIKKETEAWQIILTRQDNLFLQKVLETEIPDIKDQNVIIRDILPISRLFKKIIVASKFPQINAVGACIGKDAIRKKSVSQLIYPEQVKFVQWQENQKELFFDLIEPIKVISLIEKGNEWEVIVPQIWLSSILRRQSEMLKKVADYLGKSISWQTLEEKKKQKDTSIIWNGNLSLEEYQKINNAG
jgi:N utilization substance protein A